MKSGRAAVALCACAIGSCAARAWAGERQIAPGIAFGGAAGFSTARINHPQLRTKQRSGAYLVLDLGWSLSDRWLVGGEFTTWGTSVLGTPVHLHTIGPRAEIAPAGPGGFFARGSGGLGLTEGEVEARAGGAAALAAGCRWFVGRWVAVSAQIGAHGHLYRTGNAVFPFAAIEARSYGAHVE